jgi:uncharacterized NAD-dependent epimerase/dehydratase family protein
MPRIVILTEGNSNPDSAKTATGILRYRPEDVVAILDSTKAGRRAGELLGVGGDIPVVANVREAKADTLLIGIAPAGGRLPEAWRAILREAIQLGMDIVSGLHYFLGEDEEFRRLAHAHRVKLVDLRRPPSDPNVSADLAKKAHCHRIHTVGHDCSVGKMVTALELTAALKRRGRTAEFIPTGQTGILIAGWGPPIDRVISDFVAGAIEGAVLKHADKDFCLIEGQGSLIHPMYSGVTLGLLHGCAPQSLVMVFDPVRRFVKHTDRPMPPLRELIRIYESMASIMAPSRVVAIAANTSKLSAREAEKVVRMTEEELSITTADVIRHGSDRLVEALLQRDAELHLLRSKRKEPGADSERDEPESVLSKTRARTPEATKSRVKPRTKARAGSRATPRSIPHRRRRSP